MLSKLRSLLVCTIALAAVATHGQNTFNVGPGQTYTTIQSGINAANNGDTVLVAPGTYYENIDFKGKNITVTSTTGTAGGAANTIIDGGQNGPAVTFQTSETRAAVLYGMTITHGGTSYMNYENIGPGVSITNSQPTIVNNIITQNYCLGIYTGNAGPLIQGNVISSSLTPSKCSVSNGGGIFVSSDLLVGSPFSGTFYPAQIIGNTIENNSSGELGDGGGDGGAGIYVQGGSPLIQNNIIRNNEAQTGVGGGIYVDYTTGLAIVQNQIYDNDAGCGGGGIAFEGGIVAPPFFVLIANNTIVDNTSNFGSGYSNCQQVSQVFAFPDRYGESGPNAVLVNNIISGSTTYPAINCDNITGNRSEAAQPIFDHNLLYNADGAFFGSYCVDTSAMYGNITAAPKFVDPASHEYQLLFTSPGIDVGNNSALQSINQLSGVQITKDFAGNARLQDAKGIGYPIIDMGAYEYAGAVDAQATTIVLSSSAYTGSAGSNYVLTANLESPAGTPTGNVTFFLDGVDIGIRPIGNGGIATLSNFLLTPGVHNLYATYPGEGSFTPARSVIIIVDISVYSPSLTLTSNPNPSNLGEAVKFNVNISSADTNQLGPIVVTNTITNATLATLTPDATGNASFSTSSLPIGQNYIQANFAGDATHNSASSFPPLDQDVVSASATITTLTSSLNPSTYGQSVTFKAAVSGTTTPTGSITFTDGITTLATVSLDTSGNASFTTSSLTANYGTFPYHVITAAYTPTGSFATSSASLQQVVNGLPTADTLTVSPVSGNANTTFTATATIQSNTPGPSPTGQVIFSVTIPPSTIAQPQRPISLQSGAASFLFTKVPASFIVGCAYSGDSIYAPGTCNIVSVVVAGSPATTTTLAITAAGSAVTAVPTDTVVTLTATTLAGSSPVSPGQVNFCDATAPSCTDIHLLGTAQLTQAGTATLKFIPGPGTHSYKAVFLGTQTETTSSSVTEPLTVGPTGTNPTTTTLSANGSSGDYTLTAVVSGTAYVPPTGTISFLDTNNSNYVLATAQLAPGSPSPEFVNSSNPTFPIPPGGEEGDGISVAVADLNGDGILDLAVSNNITYTAGEVVILLGDGKGSFSFASNFTTAVAPAQIIVADLNQDGYPDLIVVAYGSTQVGSSQIQIWLNDGKGNFTLKSSYPVEYPQSAVAQDFNGDGIPDIGVLGASGLTIFLGNGDGSFHSILGPPTSNAVFGLLSADFNGDGIPDLILCNFGQSTASIFLGNGDGTFTLKQNVPTALDSTTLAVGDFNGDGKIDFAEVNFLFNTGAVHLGVGDGTFVDSTTLNPGKNPAFLAVGDFNGDGIADLITGDGADQGTTVTAMIGDGKGSFVSSPPFTTIAGATAIATGDFNGDGKVDFIITDTIENTLSVYLSTASIATATATVTNISPVGTGPHLVDANYPGDSTYATSLSNTVSLAAQRVSTTLTLTATAAPSGGPITLTAAIAPNTAQDHQAGGSVIFFNNGVSLSTGSSSGVSNGVADLTVASLPAGLDNLSAQYSGDINFAPSSGTGSITIAPPPPPDFTFIGPPTVTFRTESKGVATLSLASLNGFAALIAITCNAPLPPNYLCTLSSSTVTLAANNTSSLTLTLQPNLNAARASAPKLFHSKAELPIALASVLPLTLLALYRRRRRNPLHLLLLLLCLATASTALTACGSDTYYPATPPGLYPITVTATGTNEGSSTPTTHTLLLNANITP